MNSLYPHPLSQYCWRLMKWDSLFNTPLVLVGSSPQKPPGGEEQEIECPRDTLLYAVVSRFMWVEMFQISEKTVLTICNIWSHSQNISLLIALNVLDKHISASLSLLDTWHSTLQWWSVSLLWTLDRNNIVIVYAHKLANSFTQSNPHKFYLD